MDLDPVESVVGTSAALDAHANLLGLLGEQHIGLFKSVDRRILVVPALVGLSLEVSTGVILLGGILIASGHVRLYFLPRIPLAKTRFVTLVVLATVTVRTAEFSVPVAQDFPLESVVDTTVVLVVDACLLWR